MPEKALNQHDIEIQANRQAWDKKLLLREIYRRFYLEIANALETSEGKDVLEIGSGMGAIKRVLPSCTTSDIFPNPWLDRTESAYAINMESGTLAGIVLFDVWHHLEFPANALAEFARVLRPGGRVVLFEPAMGLLGRLVYGAFHHEPLGLSHTLPSSEPVAAPSLRYYAAQGNCWRMFYKNTSGWALPPDFKLREVRPSSAASYVLSGGFSKPQLYPSGLLPTLRALEQVLDRFPALFATRMLVSLERR
jgi:SAM-dependent methyltransferase